MLALFPSLSREGDLHVRGRGKGSLSQAKQEAEKKAEDPVNRSDEKVFK